MYDRCEVLGKFLFFAFLWIETNSMFVKTQERTRQISSHHDKTSLVNKGFVIMVKTDFFFGAKAGEMECTR